MQENNIPVTQSSSEPEIQIEQLPKQSNFIVILLSILLIISVAISGFFAFQTQKLVKELTLVRTELSPVATVEPTLEPVETSKADIVDPAVSLKTYSNTKYGFSFKYPLSTKVMGDLNGSTFTLINDSKVVTVIIGNNSLKSSVKDYYLSQISPTDPQSVEKYVSFVNLKSGDNNFVFASQDPTHFNLQATGLFNYLIPTNTNYVVNFNAPNSGFGEASDSLLNQILSSFKLLN
jgi:hypothetical protein